MSKRRYRGSEEEKLNEKETYSEHLDDIIKAHAFSSETPWNKGMPTEEGGLSESQKQKFIGTIMRIKQDIDDDKEIDTSGVEYLFIHYFLTEGFVDDEVFLPITADFLTHCYDKLPHFRALMPALDNLDTRRMRPPNSRLKSRVCGGQLSTVSAKIICNCEKAYFFTDTLGHSNYAKFVELARAHNVDFSYMHSVNIQKNARQVYDDLVKGDQP